jgi:hypothetical protein
MMRTEWLVECRVTTLGPSEWIEARDSDDAREKYEALFDVNFDALTVTDSRPVAGQ